MARRRSTYPTFLSGAVASSPENHKAHGLLAEMHLKRAGLLKEKAAVHAKAALEHAPERKCYHTLLRDALGGESDLYIRQHDALIRFYLAFIRSHPEVRQGHAIYLDHLLIDYRLEEAEQALDALKACSPADEKILFYQGDIAFLRGRHDEAIGLWQRGRTETPDGKGVYHYAERMMLCGRYTEAIHSYLASFEAEAKPRYVDAFIACAELYERMGQYEQAIAMRDKQIAILQEDWHIESGEGLEAPRREIKRLKSLIK